MSYPIEWLERVDPALPGWILCVRQETEAVTTGGIILTDTYTTGVKQPEAWVLSSSTPKFDKGDAILLSPGVATHLVFGEGADEVLVYYCSAAQVRVKFNRLPVKVEEADDILRGMVPIDPSLIALRYDRKAEAGIPLQSDAELRR